MTTEDEKMVNKLEEQIEERQERIHHEPFGNQDDAREFERNLERLRQAKRLLERASWY